MENKVFEKQVDGYNKFSYADIYETVCGRYGQNKLTFLSTSDDCEYHHLRYCKECINDFFGETTPVKYLLPDYMVTLLCKIRDKMKDYDGLDHIHNSDILAEINKEIDRGQNGRT
jgi:hypothetical protein